MNELFLVGRVDCKQFTLKYLQKNKNRIASLN